MVRIMVDTTKGFKYLSDIDVEHITHPKFTKNKYRAKKFNPEEKESIVSGIHRKKLDGFFTQINYYYYAESANGDILIFSPSGAEQHLRAIKWIEWQGPRTEEEFLREFPEIRGIL